jgi:hypothetical protein
MEPDLYKEISDIDVCKDLEIFKVKVLIRFLGTMGFSPRREGRYVAKEVVLAEPRLGYQGAQDQFWPGPR